MAANRRVRWSFDISPTIDATLAVDAQAITAIDYPRPQWVFWDVGLTLVHPSPRVIREQLGTDVPDGTRLAAADLLGSLVAAAEARHSRWPADRSGDEQVSLAWAVMLGLPTPEAASVVAGCLARTDLYRDVDESAHRVLAGLAGRGIRMGVISNSDGTLGEELAHFGLRDYFEVVVDSGVIGSDKPGRAIFHAALHAADARPEQAWHIGDGLINDYLGAGAVGMHPILLDRHGTYGDALPVHRVSRLDQVLEIPALAGLVDMFGGCPTGDD
jgi:FMN phosphatase YigB (HAD superfamily)